MAIFFHLLPNYSILSKSLIWKGHCSYTMTWLAHSENNTCVLFLFVPNNSLSHFFPPGLVFNSGKDSKQINASFSLQRWRGFDVKEKQSERVRNVIAQRAQACVQSEEEDYAEFGELGLIKTYNVKQGSTHSLVALLMNTRIFSSN